VSASNSAEDEIGATLARCNAASTNGDIAEINRLTSGGSEVLAIGTAPNDQVAAATATSFAGERFERMNVDRLDERA
jgi:hypothetical protein